MPSSTTALLWLVCVHAICGRSVAQNDGPLPMPFRTEVLYIPGNEDGVINEVAVGWAATGTTGRKKTDGTYTAFFDAAPYVDIGHGVGKYWRNQWLTQMIVEGLSARSAELSVGDLVPLFAWLYRVSGISRNEMSPDRATVTLTRVDQDEWPEGISFDLFAWPIMNGGRVCVGGLSRDSGVFAEYDREKKEYSLRLHDVHFQGEGFPLKHVEMTRTAKVGLRFWLFSGSHYVPFEVVSIVPPMPEHRIVGWVEIRRIWPKIVPFGTQQD